VSTNLSSTANGSDAIIVIYFFVSQETYILPFNFDATVEKCPSILSSDSEQRLILRLNKYVFSIRKGGEEPLALF